MKTGKRVFPALLRAGLAAFSLLGSLSLPAEAAVTVTPNSWNIVGLDSNTPAFGPSSFPVGAKVCGGAPGAAVSASLVWDAGGTDNGAYIYQRPGSNNPVSVTYGADGCADAFFEVEIAKTSAAFDQTRRFHITAGGASTPVPRELYVEHLVSQSRNGIDNVRFGTSPSGMTAVPPGGSMNLVVGNSYSIELDGHTAPGGYNQFEEFINFPNTIFQVLSVSSSYSTDNSPQITPASAYPYLYADACGWDSNPDSPYYLSCVGGDYKAGSTVITTYQVKIIGGGGGAQTLNTLLYDFSGSSYHYNADYSTGARVANIIDPASVSISKSFGPNPTNAGGISTLTIALTNPNAGAVSGLSFVDLFPTSPGAMTVASPANATSSGCGAPVFAPNPGDPSITFAGGSVAGNGSCVIQVDVTVPATGTYSNTTNHLFVDGADTGKSASATLTVNNTPAPPPPSGSCAAPVQLAQWTMDPSQGTAVPPAYFTKAGDVASASASYVSGNGGTQTVGSAQGNPANSWYATGWAAGATGFPSASKAPYFEFVLDTSQYGGVSISSQNYIASGNWASPGNNFLYIYSKADNGAFSTVYNANLPKGSWANIPATAAATTGGNTTTFRVNAVGAKGFSDPMYLDTVTFYGCVRPEANKLTLTKGFSPAPVALNGTSTLTFTVTNQNSTATAALTGIGFTDLLPAGLTVAGGSSAQCGGTLATAAPGTISFTGGTLAPGSSCSITATVTATTAGPHNNVTGFVSSTQTGANTTATGRGSASLTALLPPAISKRFAPNPILAGGVSTLTFTIDNPNPDDALSGVSFSDAFPTSPGAMTVASSPNAYASGCGAPSFAPVAGQGSISFSGGSIAAGGSCTVSVDVTASVESQLATVQSVSDDTHLTLASGYPGSAASGLAVSGNSTSAVSGTVSVAGGSTAVTGTGTRFLSELSAGSPIYIGTYRNTSGAVSASVAGNGNSASDALTISRPHPLLTVFTELASSNTPATLWDYYLALPAGGDVYYQFQVQNDGDVPLSSVTLSDSLVNTAGCSWKDGDGNPLAYPFTLAAPSNANNRDFATCVIGPFTALAGTHQNNTSASGSYVGTTYSDTDWAVYATSSLSLVKSAAQSAFGKAGDVIDYSYQVTNNGSATLVGPVTVSDNKASALCPSLTSVGNLDEYLQPGETVTCAASYTVTAADVTAKQVTNTASASTYSSGVIAGATSPTVIKTVPLAPDLSALLADSVGGKAPLGSNFTWTVTVGNAGGAGTANFSAGQTLLTDDLPATGAAYVLAGSATVAGGTAGTVNCSLTAGTLSCTAATAFTMPPAGSFSVAVTVTPSATGPLDNPKSGGVCKANPSAAVPETDLGNNDCAGSVTVVTPATLTMTKTVQAISDPVNGSSNPKAIPGAVMQYTLRIANSGESAVDSGSVVVTDAPPPNTALCVSAACGNPPIAFSCGSTPPCGLGYDYAANVGFSNQAGGGAPYGYTPSPDGNGFDANVTGVRINPSGTFAGASGGNDATFSLTLRVRVK
ncbi:MAG TPA: hypothetical protein DCZ75_09750 [Geobacter sp.]|nr:hypothetical protein [Geobacter sp.]